jgi:hypothetical protein
MTTTALAMSDPEPEKRKSATVPPTGLLLSIGDITQSKGGRDIPKRIDHFRPKEGQLEQYAAAAAKFVQVYEAEPKVLDDVYFLSNNIGDVLDIRLMAWGSSGVRLRGDTNYATLPRDEWEERAFSFEDRVTFYPLDVSEVPNAKKATWEGAPILDRLSGTDDFRIEKYAVNVECTLTFCLPKVMGFGTVAKITTKSKRSMRNLMSSLIDQSTFFQGQLIGIPFRLAVRPAKSRRFDKENRRYVPFEFFELVLDTPFTVQEAIDTIRERRAALGGGSMLALPPGEERAAESRAIAASLAQDLPPADGVQQLREEPAPEHSDDARLNRLARLEGQLGVDAVRAFLVGVFGVESASELSDADAQKYEEMLTRAAADLAEDVTDQGEIVEEPAVTGESDFQRMAREAQERGAGDES